MTGPGSRRGRALRLFLGRFLRAFFLTYSFLATGIALDDPNGRNLVYALCSMAMLLAVGGRSVR